MNISQVLEKEPVAVSVPCRVDFGGTLDISTVFLPLIQDLPCTFNIALNMRTRVTLSAFDTGWIKISSRGFDTACFKQGEAPFNHPMGLMFAVVQYFGVHGVHVHIESSSPPKSALGGSSCAAVAMIAAFRQVLGNPVDPGEAAWLAHYIEASVAGVPCGLQDQLAAAFGGINLWTWNMTDNGKPGYLRQAIFEDPADLNMFNDRLLFAYCGIPHVSSDINGRWIRSIIAGENRAVFKDIARLTRSFSTAVKDKEFELAARIMNQETQLRLDMTPDVLDNTGKKLFERAMQMQCGTRFTGAGGGGCLWAVGQKGDIERLSPAWQEILEPVESAGILDAAIDYQGIIMV